jgi:hypothetical protein
MDHFDIPQRAYTRSPLETKEVIIAIISQIANTYHIDPRIETNMINIKTFIKNINKQAILERYKTIDASINAIVELYGTNVSDNTWTVADENEILQKKLKNIINVPGDEPINMGPVYKDTFSSKEKLTNNDFAAILELDTSKKIELIKYLNYSSLMRDEYIIIDSRYQNTANTDTSKIIFNLITNTKARSERGGLIIGNSIRDIVEISISPFTIPYKPIFVNFYNKITLSINEWVTNSYEAYEGGQFHFVFDIDKIDNNLIYLKPVDATYRFSRPMNYIDNFTLTFGAMLPKITFDKDHMFVSSIDFTNQYGLFIFTEPHHLVTGDLVYISGFTTPTVSADITMINEVNRDNGHIIVKKDNYSFIINVNLSLLRKETPIGSGVYPIDSLEQVISVYFASKRIMIPLRLKYLTNYST